MTIVYFGIYDPRFSRNRVYLAGLQSVGVTIIECRDNAPGLAKYWRLARRLRALKGQYDAVVVGYPGHVVVPIAKLASDKPVVADLLGSLGDAETHSHAPTFLRRMKSALVDRLAVRFADLVLLESEAQRRFFVQRFGRASKYRVLYTGVDGAAYACAGVGRSASPFVVLFRGRLTPESGILHILEAARLLRGETNIRFRILGGGQMLKAAESFITEHELANVELTARFLSEEEMRDAMCSSALSLGQIEDNPRLSRTIPHKAYESFAAGLPYLSGDAPAVAEIVKEAETGFLTPLADPQTLAERIKTLAREPELLARVGAAEEAAYRARFSPEALARQLVTYLTAKAR